MDNSFFIKLFEYGTYVAWVVAVIMLSTRFREEKALHWIFVTCMLSFPLEWFIDNYILHMNYDPKFTPMFGHFPLFLPFAWAWFFPLVVGLLMSQEARLRKLPTPMYYITICVIWVVWDFIVEATACQFDLWVYWHPQSAMIPGTNLLKSVPLSVAGFSIFVYLLAIWAKAKYADNPEISWWRGFGAFFVRYLVAVVAASVVSYFYVNHVVEYDPTPYAPDWWINAMKEGDLPF